MTQIRSILLHLDATSASVGRLAFAHALADRQGARVTALFGVRPDTDQVAFAYSAGAAISAAERGETPHLRERERLRALLAGREPECTWCDVVGDTLVHAIVAESIYADLLVLGQQDDDEPGGPPPGFVEAAILQSGVPAIVVPYPHRQETLGERVLVAWNGSAQSARALKAALPLLRLASRVHVASWARHLPVAPFSGLDVHAWLHRHGVAARVHLREPSAHVDKALAQLAVDERADLVVMGCYGHSRLREQVFGGVSRGALATLPVPILMAH